MRACRIEDECWPVDSLARPSIHMLSSQLLAVLVLVCVVVVVVFGKVGPPI